MATTLPEKIRLSDTEQTLFVVEADLTGLGVFGRASLVVTDQRVYRVEQSETGQEAIASWELSSLTNPRLEALVDASALVADRDGSAIELLRATNAKAIELAGAEKRLKALVEGKPVPEVEDHTRICPKCGRPLPEESNVCSGCLNRGKTLLRLFKYTAPHKARLIWGTFLTLAGTICQLLPPYLTKLLIDNVLRQHQIRLFLPLMGALITSQGIVSIVSVARGRNVAYLGSQITVGIRASLFAKLQALALSFYDKRNVGSIMSRMTNDTGALYDVLVDGIPVLLNQLALLIGIPTALLLMNWRVAIWALIPVPFVILAVRWFRRRMMRVWSRFWHSWSRLSGTLNGILQGTRVVKAFHGETREVERFSRRIEHLAYVGYVAESSWASFFPAITFTMSVSTFVVWWVGGHGVLAGAMSLGDLIAFISYVGMMQQPLMMLQRIIDWSSRALTAAERVFEVMDTPEEIVDSAHPVEMPDIQGRVTFQDVHFGYDKSREVLHGIDLEVNPGEMIGLVGPSGAGKSTLINMIMRFYDPTQGRVLLDGVNLREVKIDDFRRQVGVVLQESYLFPGSIRDNIAYGRPNCTPEEVLGAAKAANAHDFIINFPDGYDSYVGERGQRLSGGERQRIAIARAILHNPKILVLDEATASVDTETERMIQQAMERLTEGRTVFAIAHRLSTLRNADRIVVIEDGRIAEIGTHQELLATEGGTYARLVEMQQQVNRMQENFIGISGGE